MKKKLLRLGILCVISCTLGCRATEVDVNAILKQARSQLGSNEALNSIETLEYQAVIEDNKGKTIGTLSLQLKKPFKQRMLIEWNELSELITTNGFEGFRLIIDKESGQQSLEVLPAEFVNQLISMAAENLYFYYGPYARGENIVYDGQEVIQGREAHKLVFQHPNNLSYIRYFDVQTGSLVMVKEGDMMIEELGEIKVNGIRFPQQIATYKDGECIRKILFQEIKVNENLHDIIFDFPEVKPSNYQEASEAVLKEIAE